MPDCCQVSGQIDLGTPSPLINKNEGVNKKTKKNKKCMCECVRRQRLCTNHYDLAEPPPVFWHIQKQLLFVDTGQPLWFGWGWMVHVELQACVGYCTHAKLMMVRTTTGSII